MKKRVYAILLTAIMLLTMVPLASAASAIPTSFKAPDSLIASESEYATELYFSIDSELLKFIDEERTDYGALGINSIDHTAQIDWKLNDGAWHYTAEWDDLSGDIEYEPGIYANTGYLSGDTTHSVSIFDLRNDVGDMTPLQTMLGNAVMKGADESGYDNRLDLKNNTFYFRVRLMVSYYTEETDVTTFILSPWSEILAYGKSGTSLEKPTGLEKPTISNPVVGKNPDGSPKITFTSITPKQVQAASNYIEAKDMKNIEMEIQINVNNTGWVEADAGTWWLASELRSFDVPNTYDNGKQIVIDKSHIQIRARYVYEGGANVGPLQSEWSNIISVNTPSWSNASTWATEELQNASELGLIPDILKGADMTKPITREEFCELAVLLYEKVTETAAAPASPNPFTDTTNSQILKAYALGITTGTSATTFSPKTLINREQCAAMLYRSIKAIAPNADYSIAGVNDFPDQKDISSWAVDATKFMSKIGIIKGDTSGNFMPKATTTAQTAAGYGMATREAAVLMTVRSFEKVPSLPTGSADVIGST